MLPDINDYELTWYMQEICMHCLGASIDYNHMLCTLQNPETVQSRLVWFHLTSFLSHAAMISKYVSPISTKKITLMRKQVLRGHLGIGNSSEVLPRDARDNIEHFDERIDNWVGDENQNILEIVLPDRAGYEYLRVNEKRVKRVLILSELIFISEKRDKSQFELSLQPLYDEVDRIGGAAEKWIKEKSLYHFIYPH